MEDPKTLARDIAVEHFYCPGVFNDDKFAKEYAIFLILRKQCHRYLKKGEINIGLALNNTVVVINSFGLTATNEVVRLLFEGPLYKIMAALLCHLKADVPRIPDDLVDQGVTVLLSELDRTHQLHK